MQIHCITFFQAVVILIIIAVVCALAPKPVSTLGNYAAAAVFVYWLAGHVIQCI